MDIANIFEGYHLSNKHQRMIAEKLTMITIAKGECLLFPGDTTWYQYYVVDGCLRSYFTDTSAKEHTIQFAINDWWISDYTSFFKKEKAILQIECLQDAVLLRFSRDDMNKICATVSGIEEYFRFKAESYIGSFQRRIIGDLSKTAKERYLDFVNTYPNIEQLVKNYHIASYLGITSESLSRIRKEIARN